MRENVSTPAETQMKPSAAVVAASLLASVLLGAATSPLQTPRIAKGASFSLARAQLAKAGIIPARLLQVGNNCGGESFACDRPGRLFCAADIEICYWLFARRGDDALFLVTVSLDEFQSIKRAPIAFLKREDVTVILPSGVRKRFASPPYQAPFKPSPPEPPIPLCSAAPAHTQPCWVKPPADYRAPR